MEPSPVPTDSPALNEQVAELLADERFRGAVRRTLGLSKDVTDRLEFRVHENDQMLAHSLAHHQDAAIALSQYFNISIQQFNCFRQVAESGFENPENLQVLDFACGYGRLLRFLAAWLPRANIRGAEIQADALEVNRHLFGIDCHLSRSDPEAFSVNRRFDVIWVASLFSHLPDRLFRAWLRKLHSLLAPGGVLCFSVRDESQFAGQMPAEGFVYRPESERIPIDSSIYGTAWASERYVRQAVASSISAPVNCTRIPRALAMEQDLYLLYNAERPAPIRPDRFRRGPWGWVDRIRLVPDGRIRIEGWACSLDMRELDAVQVCIDGDPARIATGIERADVAQAFDNPALARSGFEFNATPAEPGASAFVEVSAICQNERALLYAGPMNPRGTTTNE